MFELFTLQPVVQMGEYALTADMQGNQVSHILWKTWLLNGMDPKLTHIAYVEAEDSSTAIVHCN